MIGLCHTDIHMRDNDWGTSDFPVLLGHEGVAVVTRLGTSVQLPPVGARVAIGWIRDSCAQCGSCVQRRENLCEKGYQGTYLGPSSGIWGNSATNYHATGGCFSRIQRIEARFAVPIPDSVPSEIVCPFICGGGTVYEPLVQYGFPGAVVGISSIGGLGTAAVKLAPLMGYKVIAMSSSADKKEAALAAGAHQFVCVKDKSAMAEISGKLDFILETSPANGDLAPYMGCLKINGTYVRVGIPTANDQKFSYNYIPLIFQNQRIVGSVVTGSKRMADMFELIGKNIDKVMDGDIWKTQHMKMEQVNEAMEMLKNRKNKGYRIVLNW